MTSLTAPVQTTTVEVDTSRTTLEIEGFATSLEVNSPSAQIVSVGVQGPEGAAGVNAESLVLKANEAIGGHRAVVIEGSGVSYANYDEATDLGKVLGLTTNAAVAGDDLTVVFSGTVTENSWAFNPGPVYVGLDGMLTQTPPSTGFSQQIGIALAPNKVLVAPKTSFKLI